ncbi:MAG: preprotein translocase subunit YajC [Alistipes sp.]|nr:preprotein translocase subunit YajC [Alistipes sp.]
MTIFMMSPAPAQGAEGAAGAGGLFGGGSGMIIMMVLIFAVMWLLMIRPQQKQQKEQARFRESLQKGTKVVTAGGIHGTVKEVNASTVTLQVDKDVTIEVDKAMIMRAPGA